MLPVRTWCVRVAGSARMVRNIPKRCGLVRKVANVLRTFGVGVAEVQLLDLPGPRHGRQHRESILAVDLIAVSDAELEESSECLEVLELACGVSAVGREACRRESK